MRYFLSLLLFSTAYASNTPLIPFPVFLKLGFSSVLEFDSPPTRIVLGDATSFQVEKLESSLVVRTLTSAGVSNMFVYLKTGEVKLFTLTASEEVVPTHLSIFKKALRVIPPPSTKPTFTYKKGVKLVSAKFDTKKDFLTVEILLTADSKESISPRWDWVELRHKAEVIKAKTMWAERQVVQKDSSVRARFTFLRPNISKNLAESYLQIPVQGYASPIRINMKGRK
jgi:hypothetical protein